MTGGASGASFEPQDRREWRRWLEANHSSSKGVWLVYHKRSSRTRTVAYEEAVEEALCFGWIDGTLRRLDEERVQQWFAPRKKGSTWARSNRVRVERMIEEGMMTPAGMAKIKEAKRDGSWSMLDSVERMEVPADLAEALEERGAKEAFASLASSRKKQLIWWLLSAKREETRRKRIAEIVQLAAEKPRGRRPDAEEKR